MKRSNEYDVPIWRKYYLTPSEASEYTGIGIKKIYQIIHDNIGADFLTEDGAHFKIKRVKFEQFLDDVSTL
ncbi:MAG: transposase [Lachnospiraceae bacterium]|nr:transposase [Lachnospiraceae bacterium]